jgi:hypothetical protein
VQAMVLLQPLLLCRLVHHVQVRELLAQQEQSQSVSLVIHRQVTQKQLCVQSLRLDTTLIQRTCIQAMNQKKNLQKVFIMEADPVELTGLIKNLVAKELTQFNKE